MNNYNDKGVWKIVNEIITNKTEMNHKRAQ